MKVLLVEKKEGVLWLTLNRPDRANALSSELTGEMAQALEESRMAADVRVVVLTANGTSFCSGADLDDIKKIKNRADATRFVKGFVDVLELMAAHEAPILAGVQGPVRGGALGILAVADYVIATEQANFALPEIKAGLFPFIISPFITEIVGRRRFLEMAYTGRVLTSDQARDWGFVSEVVPHIELNMALSKRAARLIEAPRAILKRARETLRIRHDPTPFVEALIATLLEKQITRSC